jgi:hypothetical protein
VILLLQEVHTRAIFFSELCNKRKEKRSSKFYALVLHVVLAFPCASLFTGVHFCGFVSFVVFKEDGY